MTENYQQILTGYDFETEAAGWEHFDRCAVASGAFRINKEVYGDLIQPRVSCEDKDRLRIDRILIPTPKLIDAGWEGGPIGVEGKRSGEKIGKAISQALDYSRCAFELQHGFTILLRWVFLWPLDSEPHGDLGSVMAQNRIGWVRSSNRSPLVFGCGATHGITVQHDNTIEVKPLPMGRKKGNRG